MDTLKQCKTVFEFVTVLPKLFPNSIVRNNSNSGRIEVICGAIQLAAYYDAEKIVHISESSLQVA